MLSPGDYLHIYDDTIGIEAKPQLWANKTICWEANRAYKDKLMSCERTNWQLTWTVLASKKLWSAKTRRTQGHTQSSWKNLMHNKCIYWKK